MDRSPPTIADPSERAGFTDAPLSVAIEKWMATSVSGMARAASDGTRFVDARMTARKTAVETVSMINAPMSLTPWPGAVMPAFTAAWFSATMTTIPAAIAPTIWETI